MARVRPIFFIGIFIFFASVGLSRSASTQVRTVDAVGLFASGMGCGAALAGFITALKASEHAIADTKALLKRFKVASPLSSNFHSVLGVFM